MLFFFNDTAPTEIYTLSLHDALPISRRFASLCIMPNSDTSPRSTGLIASVISAPEQIEEHTSELQSRRDLVCRLLLEKKKESHYQLIQHADDPQPGRRHLPRCRLRAH